MNREQAIELARKCAKAKPKSYYAEPFQPHEWVVDAIMAIVPTAKDAEVAVKIETRCLLIDICQILDGWKACDPKDWSEWDQSVRDRITKFLTE